MQFVTRAVRVIDLVTALDMQSFQAQNGLVAFINRLEVVTPPIWSSSTSYATLTCTYDFVCLSVRLTSVASINPSSSTSPLINKVCLDRAEVRHRRARVTVRMRLRTPWRLTRHQLLLRRRETPACLSSFRMENVSHSFYSSLLFLKST